MARPLVGLTVSLPWKGYGSAIFLELGRLTPPTSPRRHHGRGEACIAVEWDWRFEAGSEILYGSSNSGPEIESGINSLRDATIDGIALSGQVPELTVGFSNGHCLRSMSMVAGHPRWSVKRIDGRWAYSKDGKLLVGTGGSSLTAEEESAAAMAEGTAKRWGVPASEPKGGFCSDCQSFVPIDGDFDLLDYGVCVQVASPFDGRVVNCGSGCSHFHATKS
jgi:hypothetical protein